ncbi:hypothetical protein, partial [Streptomyces sp. NPDC002690]
MSSSSRFSVRAPPVAAGAGAGKIRDHAGDGAGLSGRDHAVRDRCRSPGAGRHLPTGCSTLEIPLGAMCRKGLARHFDADDVFLITK